MLVLFGSFCLLQYCLCNTLINIFKPLNWVFSCIGWVPLASLQNQLIYKANLIGESLEDGLIVVFNSQDYAKILHSYFRVINTLLFVVLDSALGLISLLLSHTFILWLMRMLHYLTHTVHILFLGGRLWTSSFKELFEFSPFISEYGEIAIGWTLEAGRYLSFTFNDLFTLYKMMAYLGLSCQILLTVELAYISSLNILLLYKCTAKLYKYSLKILAKLHQIVSSTLRNNLTIEVP